MGNISPKYSMFTISRSRPLSEARIGHAIMTMKGRAIEGTAGTMMSLAT